MLYFCHFIKKDFVHFCSNSLRVKLIGELFPCANASIYQSNPCQQCQAVPTRNDSVALSTSSCLRQLWVDREPFTLLASRKLLSLWRSLPLQAKSYAIPSYCRELQLSHCPTQIAAMRINVQSNEFWSFIKQLTWTFSARQLE
jgi:hypothetical protein